MKWTNKGNFPESIVKAITNDSYSKGNADFSVTELINPPQIKRLQKIHSSEIVKDVSENIWMLLGTSVHSILEDATGTPTNKLINHMDRQLSDIRSAMDSEIKPGIYIGNVVRDILDREAPILDDNIETEYRASIGVGGYIISGAVDWYDKEALIIEDYKVVTTWKFTNGDWEDYIKQLNMYKYLFAESGRPAKQLRINAIFKDWKAREVGREGYPDYAVKQIDIPMWDSLDTLQYILDRVKLHVGASKIDDDKQLASEYPCSDKERWANTSFAVIKKGGKKASKLFSNKDDAYEYFQTINAIEYDIQDRTTFKRCEEYCDVAQFCEQFSKKKRTVSIIPSVKIDGTKPIGDDKEEHIATIVAVNKPELSLAERLKSKIEENKFKKQTPTVAEPNLQAILPKKESTGTDLLSEIMSKKVDDAIDSVNKKHGYSIDNKKDLGDTLEELGL